MCEPPRTLHAEADGASRHGALVPSAPRNTEQSSLVQVQPRRVDAKKASFDSILPVMHGPISKRNLVPGCRDTDSANHSEPTWPSLRTMRPTGAMILFAASSGLKLTTSTCRGFATTVFLPRVVGTHSACFIFMREREADASPGVFRSPPPPQRGTTRVHPKADLRGPGRKGDFQVGARPGKGMRLCCAAHCALALSLIPCPNLVSLSCRSSSDGIRLFVTCRNLLVLPRCWSSLLWLGPPPHRVSRLHFVAGHSSCLLPLLRLRQRIFRLSTKSWLASSPTSSNAPSPCAAQLRSSLRLSIALES